MKKFFLGLAAIAILGGLYMAQSWRWQTIEISEPRPELEINLIEKIKQEPKVAIELEIAHKDDVTKPIINALDSIEVLIPENTKPIAPEKKINTEIVEEKIIEKNTPKFSGSFVDKIHAVSGDVFVINQSDEKILRLENFLTDNGPDLKVYLSTDLNASDFINLGELKGNKGNQNYAIPANTDLNKFNQVLIWCEDYSVLFGAAEL